MKTYLLPLALASLAVSAMVGAQSPPPSSSSPPSSTATAPSSSSYSSSSTDSKAAMKDCLAKQKATNPSISEADAKAACSKSKDQ
jgi:hypothetical protein